MIPIVEVPQTIAEQMKNYRDIFCREEGFDHVIRYVNRCQHYKNVFIYIESR